MSGAGTQPAYHALLARNRSPMAHLLHALNQPLTGLQCSMELAMAGRRSGEQYLRALREALSLTVRMRILVETMRELLDMQEEVPLPGELLRLDMLVRQTAEELSPVAEACKIHLQVRAEIPLPVNSGRPRLAGLIFRWLESCLSLTQQGTELQVSGESDRDQAVLRICWKEAPPPEHSPFSRPELGLLIAQEGWRREGAKWLQSRSDGAQTCVIRMPLAAATHLRNPQ